jgi:hypothetical protein
MAGLTPQVTAASPSIGKAHRERETSCSLGRSRSWSPWWSGTLRRCNTSSASTGPGGAPGRRRVDLYIVPAKILSRLHPLLWNWSLVRPRTFLSARHRRVPLATVRGCDVVRKTLRQRASALIGDTGRVQVLPAPRCQNCGD